MAKKRGGGATKKLSAITKPLTKSQTLASIAESTGLTRRQVSAVFEEMGGLIHRHVKSGGAGHFTLPGLLKIKTIRKAATKARKGINPFTGLEAIFKAKPARTVVKIQPLKSLKDMVK